MNDDQQFVVFMEDFDNALRCKEMVTVLALLEKTNIQHDEHIKRFHKKALLSAINNLYRLSKASGMSFDESLYKASLSPEEEQNLAIIKFIAVNIDLQNKKHFLGPFQELTLAAVGKNPIDWAGRQGEDGHLPNRLQSPINQSLQKITGMNDKLFASFQDLCRQKEKDLTKILSFLNEINMQNNKHLFGPFQILFCLAITTKDSNLLQLCLDKINSKEANHLKLLKQVCSEILESRFKNDRMQFLQEQISIQQKNKDYIAHLIQEQIDMSSKSRVS